ncbi:molybdopterin/thiamine biosynthesis adenylyltransferase [Kribbella sp. VKM Ac-2527]|uniref:Molybdopterin/thiamine biosynthesis adenylyltransferase n=1 Tax=Kribbella caucasensis TaxID=2512215 RepID=A0A4R6K4E0_9ACTN|nr:ThiF family adenylyltransferase [Kribbella sp. VKM Ac-2527]TDO44170.1 molybdopterin/thiamine biosynthesis adenylyltransferase [Kribbella sp. VKM Ac-2527]
MTEPHLRELAAARAELRRRLGALGFADDGEVLRGPVVWTHPTTGIATATIDVTILDRYPFGPPRVQLVEAGTELDVTFHVEDNGALCLWDNTEPVNDAPWTDSERLLERVAGWLTKTAQGWPDDDDTDLERYIDADVDARLVMYDDAELAGLGGCLSTKTDERETTITVLPEPRGVPPQQRPKKGVQRSAKHLAWLADLGNVTRPLTRWDEVESALGADAATVRRLVMQGSLELLMLRYRRGRRPGILVLATAKLDGKPILRRCEAADSSEASRRLRSGAISAQVADRKVAIVGCGAVGSFTADMLFRDGVSHLDLRDPQKLRPGNVIRHLAGDIYVGLPKVAATKACLSATGLDVTHVDTHVTSVTDPTAAITLLQTHDVVVDATADERATAVLRWAAEQTQRPLVSVAVMRDGGVARVDRFPLRFDERHRPPVTPRDDLPGPYRERGCGDIVSPTPPSAVVAAAELATQVSLDELTNDRRLPATVLRVLRPQPDAPYDTLRTLTSDPGSDR